MSYELKEESPSRHKRTRSLENVLIMQGGGSLGSFACGVFKALVKQKIQ
jgi:NTE family protein